MKPIVAIVGRPNVGKSTFFNRVIGARDAIVQNFPGVTRDRHFGDAKWDDVEFTIVDTGGFLCDDEDDFAEQIRFQIFQAICDADSIILMLDGKEGISPFDHDLIEILRKETKPVFYAVNKIDSPQQEKNLFEFYTLGIEKFYPVSAEHRYGINSFLTDLVKNLPISPPKEFEQIIKLAVVGRPNVGKSSLINRILGEKRLVVSDIPGTTRDSIDSLCEVKDKKYLLIDTAGIRRKGRVKKGVEKFSVIKTLRSLDRCDVALIIIDAFEGIKEQDINIAGYAYERGCGCVLLLNKWDIVEKDSKTAKRYLETLRMESKFLNFAPALTISALTGLRTKKIFSEVQEVYRQYSMRISTGKLNKIIGLAIEKNEPSMFKGKRLKFYYATQISTKPPTIICFVNYPEAVHFSYKRFLINRMREEAGFVNTPVNLIFRKRTGQIDFSKKKEYKKDRKAKGKKSPKAKEKKGQKTKEKKGREKKGHKKKG